MKHLLVIHTGGTISMSQDQSNKVVTNDINPISLHQDVINQYAQIDELNPFNVPLVKAYMGMPGDIFSFYSREGIDGMVIEALGQGNMPPSALEGIQQLVSLNIPIVLVSRSFNGIVSPTYAYDGGGYQLAQQGFIFLTV